jgi:hypothetical protein
MSVINVSNYSSIAELTAALQDVAKTHEETVFLVVGGDVLMVVPAEVAKERIAEKIATRLAESPSLLHDLQSRLETETSEKWE